jgi:hypothetical protein
MTKADWGDVFFSLFVLALITLMVKPGSLAPKFLNAFGAATTDLVTYAVSG